MTTLRIVYARHGVPQRVRYRLHLAMAGVAVGGPIPLGVDQARPAPLLIPHQRRTLPVLIDDRTHAVLLVVHKREAAAVPPLDLAQRQRAQASRVVRKRGHGAQRIFNPGQLPALVGVSRPLPQRVDHRPARAAAVRKRERRRLAPRIGHRRDPRVVSVRRPPAIGRFHPGHAPLPVVHERRPLLSRIRPTRQPMLSVVTQGRHAQFRGRHPDQVPLAVHGELRDPTGVVLDLADLPRRVVAVCGKPLEWVEDARHPISRVVRQRPNIAGSALEVHQLSMGIVVELQTVGLRFGPRTGCQILDQRIARPRRRCVHAVGVPIGIQETGTGPGPHLGTGAAQLLDLPSVNPLPAMAEFTVRLGAAVVAKHRLRIEPVAARRLDLGRQIAAPRIHTRRPSRRAAARRRADTRIDIPAERTHHVQRLLQRGSRASGPVLDLFACLLVRIQFLALFLTRGCAARVANRVSGVLFLATRTAFAAVVVVVILITPAA